MTDRIDPARTSADPASLAQLLPHAMPPCPDARLALFAMRRMGAHGLQDARAAQAMLAAFGHGFRRPLTLMRALMADLAANAKGPIAIAPCCCVRITPAESMMLAALGSAETRPERSHLLLADLLGTRRADGVLATATAVATAFADGGRRIAG